MNMSEYIHMNLDLNTKKAANVQAYKEDKIEDYMLHVIITHYSLKAGMKKFKKGREGSDQRTTAAP